MADHGICENQQCAMCYTNFQDLLGWLDGHPTTTNGRPIITSSCFRRIRTAPHAQGHSP
jgi:hypothetical protein